MNETITKILIAEDEEFERVALKEIINNYYHETIQVICAKNGKEAVDLYLIEEPTIVLIDINMPLLNGLQAIELMKKYPIDSHFLILTSYDYFDYAKQAIQLGVEDFLLKPIKHETIINTLSSVLSKSKVHQNNKKSMNDIIKKYNEMQPILEQDCLFSILSSTSELSINKHMQRLGISFKEALCFIIDAPADEESTMISIKQSLYELGYSCLYSYIQQKHVFFIIYNHLLKASTMELLLQRIFIQFPISQWAIGIGSIQSRVENLMLSYTQAMRTLHVYNQNETFVIPFKDTDDVTTSINLKTYEKQLLDAFIQQDKEQGKKIIYDLSQDLIVYPIVDIHDHVHTLLTNLITQLNNYIHFKIDISFLPKFQLDETNKYQNLEVSLHYVLQGLFKILEEEHYQSTSVLAKKAMTYIEQNYNKQISLNDLAKLLQVTPFYVSKIMKSSFGKNFVDILSDKRIEAAKHLLKEHHRIKEIAFDVGFQNHSYFAKTFKKKVGLTPKEYQNLF